MGHGLDRQDILRSLAIVCWNWFVDKTGGFWLQLFGIFSYSARRGSGQGPVSAVVGTADSMFFAKMLVPGGVIILLFSMIFIDSSENNERDSIAGANTGTYGNIKGPLAAISDLDVSCSTEEAYLRMASVMTGFWARRLIPFSIIVISKAASYILSLFVAGRKRW